MSAWHFVSIPKKEGQEIKERFRSLAKGWGSLPVIARLGKSNWKTSIFPDKRISSYLMPLKASIRESEGIRAGDDIVFAIEILG